MDNLDHGGFSISDSAGSPVEARQSPSWLEDDEGRSPVSPQPGKPNPQEAVSHAQTDTMAAVRAPQEGYQHAEVPGFGGKLRGSKTLRRKGQPWFRQPHAAGKFSRFNKNNFSW